MVRKIRSQRLNGLFPLSYMGVVPVSPPNFIIDERAPTPNDSQNFYIGDIWLYHLPPIEEIWMLVDLQQNTALWVQLFPGAGAGATTFPANVGVAMEAGGILNILGDVTNVLTTGAGNTITITLGGAIATSYVEDVGVAIPAANILNIFGAAGIATSGAGNTVTISQGSNVPLEFDCDFGMAIPAGNILNVLGGIGCSTTGLGNTITIDLDGTVATQYTADVGIAIPVGGNLNILGGTGCSTFGAGATIQINLDASVATQYTTDAGVAVPVGNNLNLFGQAVITTTGVGDTVTTKLTPSLDGQVIIGATGLDPAWANITSIDASITITNGPNTIDLSTTGGGGGVAGIPSWVYLSDPGTANETGVTSNGALGPARPYYPIGSNHAWTSLYDVGANWTLGGAGVPLTFTAHITGYYYFSTLITTAGVPNAGLLVLAPNLPPGFAGTGSFSFLQEGGDFNGFTITIKVETVLFLNATETVTFGVTGGVAVGTPIVIVAFWPNFVGTLGGPPTYISAHRVA